MRKIYSIVLLLTLFSATSTFCFGQKETNDSLNTVVTAIAVHDVYEASYTVGFAGTVSKQYLLFKQLLSLATDQQLADLAAQNQNAVVRLYAFQALKQKKANIPNSLLEQFQHDNTIVTSLNGCDGHKMKVKALANQQLRFAQELTKQ